MKHSGTEIDALVTLMNRIHGEISELEHNYLLFIGGGDFRPRIDHFHDAIRAFVSENPKHYEPGGRLTIEWLAYDINALRYIQEMPLAPLKDQEDPLSPAADMVKGGEGLLTPPKRPDRVTRDRISDLYKNYAVLFAILLKPAADRDSRDRIDEANSEVTQLAAISAQFEAMTKGKGSAAAVTQMAHTLQDERLRKIILAFMQQGRHTQRRHLQGMVSAIREHIVKLDKTVLTVEEAHMGYALAQLAIFEGAKEVIKALATQGTSLVGEFIAEAVARSQREAGHSNRR